MKATNTSLIIPIHRRNRKNGHKEKEMSVAEVQLTALQLIHCRHFENGGKVVCVSADHTLRTQLW